jgi:MtaA/CmuA family methyltransferase
MDKKEFLYIITNHIRPEKVPVAPFVSLFSARYSNKKFSELLNNASVFVDAEIKAYEDFQYDAVWGPSLDDICSAIGIDLIIPEDEPSHHIHSLKTLDDLSNLSIYDPENSPWTEYKTSIIHGLKSKLGNDVPIIMPATSFMSMAADMIGVQNLLLSMIKDPDFIHKTLEFCLEQTIKNYQYLTEAGADVLWIAQPVPSANLISRQHYQDFCHSYSCRLFEAIEHLKIPKILHTCGKWSDRYDLVTKEGADMFHCEGINLPEFVEEYGAQVGLLGQVDTNALFRSTPEEVYQQSMKIMKEGAQNGGFILSASCDVPPVTKPENLKAMVSAARDFEY